MAEQSIKTSWRISVVEFQQWIRHSRCVILAVMLVFVHILVIAPLKTCTVLMGEPVSVLEAFIALANSGSILLIVPLLYLVLIADFPQVTGNFLSCQIRCEKRVWIAGQVIFAVWSAAFTSLFLLVSSAAMLLLSKGGTWQMHYSHALTHYTSTFPDQRGDHIAALVPENLYQQMSLATAFCHSLCLMFLHFFIMALVILLMFLINKKYAGIIINGILVVAGALTCQMEVEWMWFFPVAHTIPWLHYEKYLDETVFPIRWSYLGLSGAGVMLIFLCFMAGKNYQSGEVPVND